MSTSLDWTFVYSEGHSLILNEAFFNALTNYSGIPGIFNSILYINKKGLQTCYVPKSELDRVRDEGNKFFDKEFREKFQNDIARHVDKFKLFWQSSKIKSYVGMSNTELLADFDEYIENLELMLAYYQVSGGRCFPVIEEFTKTEMSKYFSGDDLEKNYGLLLISSSLDILEREEIDLHKFANSTEEIKDESLIEHAQNYAFHYISTYDESKIISSLRDRINEIKETWTKASEYEQKLLEDKDDIKEKQKVAIETISSNPNLVELVDFLRNQGRIRFEYKEWFFGAEFKFRNLLGEIANRAELSLADYLNGYSLSETKSLLINNSKVESLERKNRAETFIFYRLDNQKHFYSGEEAARKATEIMPKNDEIITELRGSVANQGKVSGRARVILTHNHDQMKKELAEFLPGEILVTTMTQPIFVSIMKIAGGVVTNQGGITSHAAVLSREFNVPCVIGTYKATEIFKTGDLLEVDADNGVVRKIK